MALRLSRTFKLLKYADQNDMTFSVQLFSISPRRRFIRILQSVRLTLPRRPRSSAWLRVYPGPGFILACLSDLSKKKCGTGPLS